MFKNKARLIFIFLFLCSGVSSAANSNRSEISIISATSVLLPKNAVFIESAGAGFRGAAEFSQGVWAARKYTGVSFYDGKDSDVMFYGFEAGYEKLILNGYYIGLYADYNSGDTEIGGHSGSKISNEFYSVGLYGLKTWGNGIFAQISAKNFFTKSDLKGSGVNCLLERNVASLYAQLGKKIDFKDFVFEPEFSLNYFSADAKKNETADFGASSVLDAKVSLLIGFAQIGGKYKAEPYIGAGFGYSFSGGTDIVYNGKTFVSDISGSFLEAVFGARAVFSDALSASAGFTFANAQYGSSYGVLLSVKYSFAQETQSSKEDRVGYKNYTGFKPIIAQDNPKTEDFYDEEVVDLTPVEEYSPVFQGEDGYKKEGDFDVLNLNGKESEENVKRDKTSFLTSPDKAASAKKTGAPEPEITRKAALSDKTEIASSANSFSDKSAQAQSGYNENYVEGKGKKITLGSSFFKPGQTDADQKGKTYLTQITNMLKDVNIKRIIITGHVDAENDGQDFLKKVISENRAASVAQALAASGIPESKIKFKGEGSSKPLKKKKGQKPKPNRRVEIEIFE